MGKSPDFILFETKNVQALYEKYSPYFRGKFWNFPAHYDDLMQEAWLCVHKAVERFDPKKVKDPEKFAGFYWIEFEIKRLTLSTCQREDRYALSEVGEDHVYQHDFSQKLNQEMAVERFLKSLDPKQRKMVKLLLKGEKVLVARKKSKFTAWSKNKAKKQYAPLFQRCFA